MEKILEEKVNTVVKLMISRFTKGYIEKLAVVEVVKCICNADTGETIKKDPYQNIVFRNQKISNQNPSLPPIEKNEFDSMIQKIKEKGEDDYFNELLELISKTKQ